MKTLFPDYKPTPTDLGKKYLTKCSEGRWFHFQRAFVVKKNDGYNGVSFNLFERVFQQFLQIFKVNYFAKCLKSKTITVLNNKDLSSFLPIIQKNNTPSEPKAVDLLLDSKFDKQTVSDGEKILTFLATVEDKKVCPENVKLGEDEFIDGLKWLVLNEKIYAFTYGIYPDALLYDEDDKPIFNWAPTPPAQIFFKETDSQTVMQDKNFHSATRLKKAEQALQAFNKKIEKNPYTAEGFESERSYIAEISKEVCLQGGEYTSKIAFKVEDANLDVLNFLVRREAIFAYSTKTYSIQLTKDTIPKNDEIWVTVESYKKTQSAMETFRKNFQKVEAQEKYKDLVNHWKGLFESGLQEQVLNGSLFTFTNNDRNAMDFLDELVLHEAIESCSSMVRWDCQIIFPGSNIDKKQGEWVTKEGVIAVKNFRLLLNQVKTLIEKQRSFENTISNLEKHIRTNPKAIFSDFYDQAILDELVLQGAIHAISADTGAILGKSNIQLNLACKPNEDQVKLTWITKESLLKSRAIASKLVAIDQMLTEGERKSFLKEIRNQKTVIDLSKIMDKKNINPEILDELVLNGAINAWSIHSFSNHDLRSLMAEWISNTNSQLMLQPVSINISFSPEVKLEGIVRDQVSINKEKESKLKKDNDLAYKIPKEYNNKIITGDAKNVETTIHEIVRKLNARTKLGMIGFDNSAEIYKALKFLKENGFIHTFSQDTAYRVALTESDKEAQ